MYRQDANLFLQAAQKDVIPVHRGKRVVAISQPVVGEHQLGVTATFSDGTCAVGDILVGAN
jgi:hypothetical protein